MNMWSIYTSHMVLFLLFRFSSFLRLNRLLFAGVCLVGASRAPRASLTRAQQHLNNYSAEYNLSPISRTPSHMYGNLLILEDQGCWIMEEGEGRGGGLVNILSATTDNTFNPPPFIPPCSKILTLCFTETIKTDFLLKKRCKIVLLLQTCFQLHQNTLNITAERLQI